MYVCSCFGITEQQVKQHADDGRCTPRQIASACKAGTDCGSCVKRIQGLLGRGAAPATTRTQRLAAMLADARGAEQPAAARVEPDVPAAARAERIAVPGANEPPAAAQAA
ncbi:bacterioferritin-associated ferredoxin [Streptomyces sp. NPDC088197]|uniref:(2Fe-2S)-binding protein n=1 Tax=unclassified Streptomyces TaxID=2593676 RepID=UPI0036EF6AE6